MGQQPPGRLQYGGGYVPSGVFKRVYMLLPHGICMLRSSPGVGPFTPDAHCLLGPPAFNVL